MFGLFRKKEKKPAITDLVYATAAEKFDAIVAALRESSHIIIIAWFEESYRRLEDHLKATGHTAELFMAREAAAHHVEGKKVFFLEHYPLIEKERALLSKLEIEEAVFFSALNEPLLKYFGGERILVLVKDLGLRKGDAMQHAFITSSIRSAQEKLQKRTELERTAHSDAEWFERNT